MAVLQRHEDQLILELSRWERLGAMHQSPITSVSNVISVTAHPNLWAKGIIRGVRAPGTGIFLFILLGSLWSRKNEDFCAIYGKKSGFVIELRDSEFDRWLFTTSQSEKEINLLIGR